MTDDTPQTNRPDSSLSCWAELGKRICDHELSHAVKWATPIGLVDTPPELKPRGCSDERADEMTASISAAYGLKGLPGPTGRGMHGRVAW